MTPEPLTEAQQELYDWLVTYIRDNQHSPSIRQMMRAMGLKSPAPIQARLDHLRKKGWIDWDEGKARTVRILEMSDQIIWLAWGRTGQGDDLLGAFDNEEAAATCADAHDGWYEYGNSVSDMRVQSKYVEDAA